MAVAGFPIIACAKMQGNRAYEYAQYDFKCISEVNALDYIGGAKH